MYKSRFVLTKYAFVGSCFASTNSSSAKVSVNKVLVVSKLSRYEYEQYRHKVTEEAQLKDKLKISAVEFEKVRDAHDRHKIYEKRVLDSMKTLRLDVRVVNRLNYNDACVKWADIVVPVGGDGTFLLAASRVRDNITPVVGFNSDPYRSEGYLCLPKRYSTNVSEALIRIIKGDYRWLLRNRIRATLMGVGGDLISTNLHEIEGAEQMIVCTDQPTEKILPYLALNEVFIGETMSAKVSNLDIWLNNESYETSIKCSGLCVSTGTGSTSWHSSINRLSVHTVAELLRLLDMNPTEDENSIATLLADMYNKRLIFSPTHTEVAYTIRDLVSAGVWPKPKGIKPTAFAKKIRVRSKCYDASLVIDGGVSFAFNACTSVLLEMFPEDALRTVQFADAECK